MTYLSTKEVLLCKPEDSYSMIKEYGVNGVHWDFDTIRKDFISEASGYVLSGEILYNKKTKIRWEGITKAINESLNGTRKIFTGQVLEGYYLRCLDKMYDVVGIAYDIDENLFSEFLHKAIKSFRISSINSIPTNIFFIKSKSLRRIHPDLDTIRVCLDSYNDVFLLSCRICLRGTQDKDGSYFDLYFPVRMSKNSKDNLVGVEVKNGMQKFIKSFKLPVNIDINKILRLCINCALHLSYVSENSVYIKKIVEHRGKVEDLVLTNKSLKPKNFKSSKYRKSSKISSKKVIYSYKGVKRNNSEKRKLCTHFRSGHWHSYWTGPKGNKKLIQKWIPGVIVKGSYDDGRIALHKLV